MRLIEELRQRFPGLAKRANSGSRQAAIRLFCMECMGGQTKEVNTCEENVCPLHPFRIDSHKKQPSASETGDVVGGGTLTPIRGNKSILDAISPCPRVPGDKEAA